MHLNLSRLCFFKRVLGLFWARQPECRGVPNPLALRVLMHQNLQCQGVRNPLALRLKIGLTCYLFWGVCAIKPQAKTTTSCCLLSGVLMCSVCPSSRFTLRPAASFPPVASSADLLRCRRKSVKHGEDILEGEENWHQEASSRGEGGVTLPAQVANHAWERLQRHGNCCCGSEATGD